MLIKCDKIYSESGVQDGYLEVEEGRIVHFLPANDTMNSFLDYTGYRIIPGIIDTHIHGTRGYGLLDSDDSDPEDEVRGFLKGCAADGITGVFPTAAPNMCKAVAKIAKEKPVGARILGIHSEGPYLNRVGENGIQTDPPTVDMEEVKRIYEDCAGFLKLMAIAPEIERSQQVIDYLRDKGVVLSFAHSNCNYEEALEAFKHGISVSTHTANVMSGIHHRNMGGLGACLLDREIFCEVICDGMHVSPAMLEIMFRVKDLDYWMMISDSSQMAGAPTGTYKFMKDFEVTLDRQGFCKSDTGRLMGSTKSVLYGISVLTNQLNLPLEKVLRMASLNAAQFYGFGKQKGSIAIGKDADFVVINDAFDVIASYVEGQKVFDQKTDKKIFKDTFINKYKVK